MRDTVTKQTPATPNSYSPKIPEILNLAEKFQNERLIDTIQVNGAVFEIVGRPEVVWVGTISYAENLIDEPDIGKLLRRYQELIPNPKLERINPDWDAAISIDYWQGGKVPRGMMFGQETTTEKQAECYDIYKMPASKFMRILNDENAARLLGKERCENHELFIYMREKIMPEHGYKFNENGAQEIEYHNYKTNAFIAYVPIIEI